MKKKTTKKTMVRWGTKFRYPSGFGEWHELLGRSKKQLEKLWINLEIRGIFDPKKCTKVKVTKI